MRIVSPAWQIWTPALPVHRRFLRLDINRHTGHRLGTGLFQVVELSKIARRNPELRTDILVRIAGLGQDIMHAVRRIDLVSVVRIDGHLIIVRVDRRIGSRPTDMRPNMGLAAAAIRPFVRNIQAISIGPVEQIELVVLDDAG